MKPMALKPRANSTEDHQIRMRIRVARIAAGLSQEKLAERLGVSFQQVQKYEKGTNRVSASRLLKISKELTVSVGRLIGADDDMTDPAALAVLSTRDGYALMTSFNAITDMADRAIVVAVAQRLAVL